MKLTDINDWEDRKERWTAFWQGEIIDRPIMLITVPSENPNPIPTGPLERGDIESHWTNVDHQVAWLEARTRSVSYHAEAIPAVSGGPLSAWCAYYGGAMRFLKESIWHEPLFDDWRDAPDWEHDWRDEGYDHLREMVAALCRSRANRFYVGYPPTLHSAPSDMLSSMRRVDRFLADLVDHPDEVVHAIKAMAENACRIYDELYALIHSFGYEGYGNWWPIWCPESLGVFQSDVSCMISPKMFERFVAPHLEITSGHVAHGFYHLDGPDAINHVERVCDITNMRAIQWVPGAGTKPGALQWMGLFKRIQRSGCAAYFSLSAAELEPVIEELDPRLLILGTSAPTREEADELQRQAVRFTARYWGKRT